MSCIGQKWSDRARVVAAQLEHVMSVPSASGDVHVFDSV